MLKGTKVIPEVFFARIVTSDRDRFVEANESPDEFDEVGPVGKYQLIEIGKVTIEKAFVPAPAKGGKRGT